MRLLFVLTILASGCASQSAPEASDSASGGVLSGTVTAVDLSPWAYDGDGVIGVTMASGESVRVLIPARMNLCNAQGLTEVSDLSVGDRVEVVGEADGVGGVRPCMEASHRVTRLSR